VVEGNPEIAPGCFDGGQPKAVINQAHAGLDADGTA
jgi:hypothetical protein